MSNNWQDKRTVVTGGGGFIGSNLCRTLLDQGAFVTVVDDFSTGKRRNLDFVKEAKYDGRFSLCEIDIRNEQALGEAFSGNEIVLHLAALGSVPKSIEHPEETNDINVTGSLKVFKQARDQGCKRVVIAGSSAVYGDNPELPKIETMRPEPMSPYATSKIAMEYYATDFTRHYDLPVAILRFFNVFGPHQDPHSIYAAAIPIFVHKLLKGEAPTIFGDGEQTRDFIHVYDVVAHIMQAAMVDKSACGSPINVAGGSRITVNRLYNRIRELLGLSIDAIHVAERDGDVKHSVASVDKAKQVLGITAKISVEEGLEKSIEWYKEDFLRSENR